MFVSFYHAWTIGFLFACTSLVIDAGGWGFSKKSKYTPLLFFTVPSGMIPECDAMERAVRKIEKDVGVRVERLDLLRTPEAEAVLGLLTQKTPPFLYHRESAQVVHIPTGGSIDLERLRRWTKGRMVSSSSQYRVAGISSPTPQTAARRQEAEEDEEDMIENMSLTPTQLEGKQKMKERTKERTK